MDEYFIEEDNKYQFLDKDLLLLAIEIRKTDVSVCYSSTSI